MKKICITLALIGCVIFASCSSKKSDTIASEDQQEMSDDDFMDQYERSQVPIQLIPLTHTYYSREFKRYNTIFDGIAVKANGQFIFYDDDFDYGTWVNYFRYIADVIRNSSRALHDKKNLEFMQDLPSEDYKPIANAISSINGELPRCISQIADPELQEIARRTWYDTENIPIYPTSHKYGLSSFKVGTNVHGKCRFYRASDHEDAKTYDGQTIPAGALIFNGSW